MPHVEEIYKIVDTTTNAVLMTGRSRVPKKRATQYRRYDWWKPEYQLVPYRVIARREMNDGEYGMYAAAVEHMEICRNKTWDVQGGRNKMSPLVQQLWGPEFRREYARIGGLIQGPIAGQKSIENGHIQRLGRIYGPIQGPKNRDSGLANRLGKTYGAINGAIAAKSGQLELARQSPKTKTAQREVGRKCLESGQLDRIRQSPKAKEAQSKSGRRNVESGHLASIRTFEGSSKGGKMGGRSKSSEKLAACALNFRVASHKRWHVNRQIINPSCELCRTAAVAA
jgi:hypothetical protein